VSLYFSTGGITSIVTPFSGLKLYIFGDTDSLVRFSTADTSIVEVATDAICSAQSANN